MNLDKNIDISIIVPSLNSEDNILETLECISASIDYEKSIHSEIIIVDGGSTDKTMEVVDIFVRKQPKNRVRYVSRKDSGAAQALNDGFDMAAGKYLTFCDSDDLFTPKAISVFMEMFKNYDVVVGEREGFKVENGKKIVTYTKATSKRPLLKEITKEIKDNYFLHHHICSTPFAFSKKVFEESGGINEKMKAAYDYDLALKIIYPGLSVNIPGYTDEVLLNYRYRPNSVSNVFRERQVKEAEVALNDTFKRIGFKGIEAVFVGRDGPGYLYWEHRKTTS